MAAALHRANGTNGMSASRFAWLLPMQGDEKIQTFFSFGMKSSSLKWLVWITPSFTHAVNDGWGKEVKASVLKIKVQTTDGSLMNKLVFYGAARLDYRASSCCEISSSCFTAVLLEKKSLIIFCCCCAEMDKQGPHCVKFEKSWGINDRFTVSALFLLHCTTASSRHMFVFQQPSCMNKSIPQMMCCQRSETFAPTRTFGTNIPYQVNFPLAASRNSRAFLLPVSETWRYWRSPFF